MQPSCPICGPTLIGTCPHQPKVYEPIKMTKRTPEDNETHLCTSCCKEYPDCDSSNIIFGTGKGNDNIVACNIYTPLGLHLGGVALLYQKQTNEGYINEVRCVLVECKKGDDKYDLKTKAERYVGEHEAMSKELKNYSLVAWNTATLVTT